jgi:hypothetical protein
MMLVSNLNILTPSCEGWGGFAIKCDTYVMDLSRFDAAPLIAFTATKETDYGTETNRRI